MKPDDFDLTFLGYIKSLASSLRILAFAAVFWSIFYLVDLVFTALFGK